MQKDTFAILSKEIAEQHIQMIKVDQKTINTDVPSKLKEMAKLNDDEIIFLAKIANKLQEHYYHPQDTEWAKDGKNLYIVQTRPVTTVKAINKSKAKDEKNVIPDTPILSGAAASPGIGTGVVKIVKNPKEIENQPRYDLGLSWAKKAKSTGNPLMDAYNVGGSYL